LDGGGGIERIGMIIDLLLNFCKFNPKIYNSIAMKQRKLELFEFLG
jgi:hypothetical protein